MMNETVIQTRDTIHGTIQLVGNVQHLRKCTHGLRVFRYEDGNLILRKYYMFGKEHQNSTFFEQWLCAAYGPAFSDEIPAIRELWNIGQVLVELTT